MRQVQAVTFLTLIFLSGCDRPAPEATVDQQEDALESLNEAVYDALDAIRESSAPRAADGEQPVVISLPAVIKIVVKAAEELVKVTAGKPMEADARGILTAAQELEKKAAASASAQVTQGLQELRANVATLRRRK